MDNSLLFAHDGTKSWFRDKYYNNGNNARYWTFQLVLNFLNQTKNAPIIVETGCQRQKDDFGAGMSTSIFGEYVSKYGGKLITVDLVQNHLNICKECTQEWEQYITYIESDSLKYLANYHGPIDLLYLDSYDYPIGLTDWDMQERINSQTHCVQEFLAIKDRLQPGTLLLLDDNMLPGGGKPLVLKEQILMKDDSWLCLLDFQQSLWIKGK